MYCPKCGNVLSDNAKFCPKCGYRIDDSKEEKTKEINISIIKQVEQNPKYNFNISKKYESSKNNNYLIVVLSGMIIVFLGIVLLILQNKKEYLTDEDKLTYCNDNAESSICNSEENNVDEDFEALDFSDYDFTESSSKEAFYNQVISILAEKEEAGNNYCNNQTYTDASNKLNSSLKSEYSYICGMDITYLNNLTTRLSNFYTFNKLDDSIVDAYVVGKGGFGEYANYTYQVMGSNSTYIAYLRRIHISINLFQDYDKLQKTYERDLESGYHPKNSVAEDIIVHETAHALDLYITASKLGIGDLVIDDYSKYNELYSSWSNQSYSKSVVQEAVENVNKNNGTNKTEQELREEISGYAASSKNGVIMYAETFAEAMVDYFANGDNASSLSIEIYKIVEEDIANL